MFRLLLPLVLLLAACDTVPVVDLPERRSAQTTALPPMKTFGAVRVLPPARANTDIANDFLDLSFQMESGRALRAFSRFETPVRVGVIDGAPPGLHRDLDRLLGRLRHEAGIDIARARPGETVNIVIQTVPRREMQRIVPEAACFVVPNVTSWSDFNTARRSDRTDWTRVVERSRAAIFLPGNVSSQEIRDCLHEELAQALGPLNDLYRLQDSIFNDDNFQTVLTGFDMLVLRLTYAPELRAGMSRAAVAARLPSLLARMNPGGRGRAAQGLRTAPRDWINAVENALGARGSDASRLLNARRAVAIAQAEGWSDGRSAFGLFLLGRLAMGRDGDLAVTSFLRADAIYRALPGHQVQSAHLAMQMAAFSLSSGQPQSAIDLVDRNLPAAIQSENAALMSTLMMIKAEALDYMGQRAAARALRLDSLGWARYGFGNERDVRARLHEIAALTPRKAES